MSAIYGVGNPLMDIIMRSTIERIKELGVVPNTMNLVDSHTQEKILSIGTDAVRTPGGSCANTIRALAWLDFRGEIDAAYYTGGIGNDREGKRFEKAIKEEGVTPLFARKASATGSSAILVTPDGERTMFTNLGACRELSSKDVDYGVLAGCKVLHTTGYMWDTENQAAALEDLVPAAQESDVLVSFDIADPFVVHRYRDRLLSWLPGKADILFANQEELSALVDVDDDPAAVISAAREFAKVVVMKTGAAGCVVQSQAGQFRVPGEEISVVDTTGAGDAFAGGFLYGVMLGKELEECGRLANRLASRICTVEGCRYETLQKSEIRAAI